MNVLHRYQAYQVETVSPEDRVAVLYDGARRFVDQAAAALAAQQYDQVSAYTGKAQRILGELSATLNYDAGEIAKSLFQLYDYWIWRLTQGLINREPTAYTEVSNYLAEFRDVWAEAARQVRSQRAARVNG